MDEMIKDTPIYTQFSTVQTTAYQRLKVVLVLHNDKHPITLHWTGMFAAVVAHAVLHPGDDNIRIAHRLNTTPEHINWIMSQYSFTQHDLYELAYYNQLRGYFERHQLMITLNDYSSQEEHSINTLLLLSETLDNLQQEAFELLPKRITTILHYIQSYPDHPPSKIAEHSDENLLRVMLILRNYGLLTADVRKHYAYFKRLETSKQSVQGNDDQQAFIALR